MSKVYIVNEPIRRDDRPHFDFTSARKYGEFVFLMPSGSRIAHDPEASLQIMRPKLINFTAEDYLIPIGHPLLIAWASILAARATGGSLNILHWLRNEFVYQPVCAQIYRDGL